MVFRVGLQLEGGKRLIFERLETSDEDGAVIGVMLISNGKVVDMFPSVALAIANAEYEFTIGIERALRSSKKIARLVFERQDSRVIELDDGRTAIASLSILGGM
jgi:hypothetical protein